MVTPNISLGLPNDLDVICKDRELETIEQFQPNAFYGIGDIVKQYARYPVNRPLRVVVPHGVVLSSSYVWRAEISSPCSLVFCYPVYRMQAYRKQLRWRKLICNSASPYLYLLKLIEYRSGSNRIGTVFFPSHSTHHIKASIDTSNLIKRLQCLDEVFHPITICIYWKDYLQGQHIPFMENGFDVVSAGHIFDREFLYRFHNICSNHEFACSNEIGSHTFYSIESGCKYRMLDDVEFYRVASEEVLSRDSPCDSDNLVDRVRNGLELDQSNVMQRQKRLADEFLGKKYLKNKTILNLQFKFADVLYNFGLRLLAGRK